MKVHGCKPIIAAGLVTLIVAFSLLRSSEAADVSGCPFLPVSQYKAVNFIDKRLMAKETNQWLTFEAPSIYDRLNEIKSTGLNAIRLTYFWEGYTANPVAFVNGLQEISTTADQLGLCVVYDFHQGFAGSHFDYWGGGFPSFLTGSYSGNRDGELSFWNDYYDNNISYKGTKIWDLQFNLIRDVVIKNVDSHPSTAGYEILNEPAVNDCNQFAKIGNMQTYIGSKIREVTSKPIFFDRAENESCQYSNDQSYDKQVMPRGISNLVFAPHIYTKGSPTILSYLLSLSHNWQPGMRVFIGEWGQISDEDSSSSSKFFGYKDNNTGIVTQDVVDNYLQAFKNNNVGWAYYSWDPVYTYAIKDQSYKNTIYKAYLQNGISRIYGN